MLAQEQDRQHQHHQRCCLADRDGQCHRHVEQGDQVGERAGDVEDGAADSAAFKRMISLASQAGREDGKDNPARREDATHADRLGCGQTLARQLDHGIVDDEQTDGAQHCRGAACIFACPRVARFLHLVWIDWRALVRKVAPHPEIVISGREWSSLKATEDYQSAIA